MRLFLLALSVFLFGLVGSSVAEGTRSISSVASLVTYIRTANVGIDSAAEAVDLSTLSRWYTSSRSFSVAITNEDSTNDLLVKFIESGSVTASTLTTPADATLSDVVRIEEGTTVSTPVGVVGWIWQSEKTAVNAHALVSR